MMPGGASRRDHRPGGRLGTRQSTRQSPSQTRAHGVLDSLRTGGANEGGRGFLGDGGIRHDRLGRRGRAQPGGDGVELGRGGASSVGLVGHAVAQDLADPAQIVPADGGDRQDLNIVKPVGGQEAAHVLQQGCGAPGGQGVDLVDQNQHVLLAGPQAAQIALVERSVGVLLRVDNPHEDVRQRHQPVDLQGVGGGDRVVVGHIEQYQSGELVLIGGVQEGLATDAPLPIHTQEIQKRIRVVAPRARRSLRGGGAARADIGELQLGQGVEQGGLSRPGPAEQGHDGMIHAQSQALTDLVKCLPSGNSQGGGHLRGADVESCAQARQTGLEVDGIERFGV